jgi:hypothetical protein
MPSSRRVNQHEKRDRLPSAAALARAREGVLEWWHKAWSLQGEEYVWNAFEAERFLYRFAVNLK